MHQLYSLHTASVEAQRIVMNMKSKGMGLNCRINCTGYLVSNETTGLLCTVINERQENDTVSFTEDI